MRKAEINNGKHVFFSETETMLAEQILSAIGLPHKLNSPENLFVLQATTCHQK